MCIPGHPSLLSLRVHCSFFVSRNAYSSSELLILSRGSFSWLLPPLPSSPSASLAMPASAVELSKSQLLFTALLSMFWVIIWFVLPCSPLFSLVNEATQTSHALSVKPKFNYSYLRYFWWVDAEKKQLKIGFTAVRCNPFWHSPDQCNPHWYRTPHRHSRLIRKWCQIRWKWQKSLPCVFCVVIPSLASSLSLSSSHFHLWWWRHFDGHGVDIEDHGSVAAEWSKNDAKSVRNQFMNTMMF